MNNLEQVFLYVTRRCNLRCAICYALPQLERGVDLDFDQMVQALAGLRAEGAWKLTILGGEPTSYRPLTDLLSVAKQLGYRFLRINTNGLFPSSLLADPRMHQLDVICFSIDGATQEVNAELRGGAQLDRITANMQAAVSQGYDVRINFTVTSRNLDQVFGVIELAQEIQASEVNMNVIFQMGEALEHADLAVSPGSWLEIYSAVLRWHEHFSVRIKIPRTFALAAELAKHRERGHHCLALDGTRVYVASNGDTFPCVVMMDDRRYRTREFDEENLAQLHQPLSAGDSLNDHCYFIKRLSDGFLPLCIFYKERLNYDQVPDSTVGAGSALVPCALDGMPKWSGR